MFTLPDGKRSLYEVAHLRLHLATVLNEGGIAEQFGDNRAASAVRGRFLDV